MRPTSSYPSQAKGVTPVWPTPLSGSEDRDPADPVGTYVSTPNTSPTFWPTSNPVEQDRTSSRETNEYTVALCPFLLA